jgi:hypothetical protein
MNHCKHCLWQWQQQKFNSDKIRKYVDCWTKYTNENGDYAKKLDMSNYSVIILLKFVTIFWDFGPHSGKY